MGITRPTIALNMIVRNEAAVIQRCLDSVRPYIIHWTVCDTGSEDGTPEIVAKELEGIPGKLYREPWLNFGHNRSSALQRGRGTADYHLLIDADMALNVDPITFVSCDLTADAYLIPFAGPMDYSITRLVSDRHEWKYIGATHEYVYSETAKPALKLRGISIVHYEDGASRPQKYERDIKLLKEEIEREPSNPRTVFYLAQSYRDMKQFEPALDLYEKRALMGGWDEETWNALYQLGRIQQAGGYDWRVVLNSYLQAYNFRPSRLESIYPIARFYREHEQWSLGHHFARLCMENDYPDDILFVERPVYQYLLPYEYAICCHHTGREEETQRIIRLLEERGETPREFLSNLKALA